MKPFPIPVTFVIGASIAATGLVVGDFKPVPQAVAVAVAALTVGASFSRWRGAIWFVRGVLFAAGWSALWLALYGAAVWITPPVTADGHQVMPIGQVFLAFIGSTVLGPAAAFYYVKTGRGNVKTEAVVVRVLAAVVVVTALIVNLQFESWVRHVGARARTPIATTTIGVIIPTHQLNFPGPRNTGTAVSSINTGLPLALASRLSPSLRSICAQKREFPNG